jgi:GTP-binding protein
MPPSLILEATAFAKDQLIHPEAPQVALAGRSNVGKSSLINALAGRKRLAKISATPGKTRSVNYYRVEPWNAYIVDLPGYGYAQCGRQERNAWAALLEQYLRGSPGLCALALLLDARLPPQNSDQSLVAFAANLALPLIPVFTKADKCNKREIVASKHAWGTFLDVRSIIVTSSEKKTGMESLWDALLRSLALTE